MVVGRGLGRQNSIPTIPTSPTIPTVPTIPTIPTPWGCSKLKPHIVFSDLLNVQNSTPTGFGRTKFTPISA